MTEESKYYTPSLEEFHHGFIVQSDWNQDGNWKDEIYDNHHGTCDLGEQLDVFRVKYLDKEDIESCGWTHDYNDDGEESPNLHDKHGYSSGYHIDKQNTPLNTAYLLFHFPDNFVIIDSIVNCGSGREEMLFRGTIKNKSEFIRLMRQIGISK